jgi:hypothetical protein
LVFTVRTSIGVAALLVVSSLFASASAQGVCEANNQASCAVGGDATHAITVTISTVARLSSASSTITIPVPSTTSFANGFGTPVATVLALRSNTSYAVAISAASATWTGVPGSAWQTKPAGDLEWSLDPAGPFVSVTTTPVSVSTGSATGNGVLTVYLRSRFVWASDVPGSYSLPVRFTLTAP